MADINSLHIGQREEYTKKITEEDIQMFARATGDYNYLHTNNEKAQKSIFKGRIAHGMLTAGLISAVLGTKLPGEGSIFMSQSLSFIKPVRIDDTITARVEISNIDMNRNIVTLNTKCFNQKQELVLDGEAKLKVLN